ncbi:MAG: outer membrane beta-barrel protein [Bacteroidota bacterium]
MKHPLILFLLFLVAWSPLGLAQQQRPPIQGGIRLYTGVGYQHYRGDLGNGLYNFKKNCTWGTITLGTDLPLGSGFDLKVFGTAGAFGYLSGDRENPNVGINEAFDNLEVRNLSARFFTGVVALQYNFNNGWVLPRDSRWVPAIYVGSGWSLLEDIMGMGCINVGDYTTVNVGANLRYAIHPDWWVGVKFNAGYFTRDDLDFHVSRGNDMHLQSSLVFGYAFRARKS